MPRADVLKDKPNGKDKKRYTRAGQPTAYKEEYNAIAEEACDKLGAKDKDLAALFRVTPETIWRWKKTHEEFFIAIKRGQDLFDNREVEKSLKSRALGYSYTETSTKTSGKGKKAYVEVTVSNKKMAPDIGAAIFWLTNRAQDRWKQTRYVQHAGKVEGVAAIHNHYDLTDIREEELEQLYNVLGQAVAKKHDKAKPKSNGASGTA